MKLQSKESIERGLVYYDFFNADSIINKHIYGFEKKPKLNQKQTDCTRIILYLTIE